VSGKDTCSIAIGNFLMIEYVSTLMCIFLISEKKRFYNQRIPVSGEGKDENPHPNHSPDEFEEITCEQLKQEVIHPNIRN
jgi:hypothetical protein